MSPGHRAAVSLIAMLSLLGGVSGCGGSSETSRGQRALDLDLPLPVAEPVSTSFDGNTFTATFSGDDADLSFGANVDPGSPSVTGGGWIVVTPGSGKGTFAVFAAFRPDGTLRGTLSYVDHDIGLKVTSTTITD